MTNILKNVLTRTADSDNKTENDKAKEAGARTINQKATPASGYSVPERIWNFLTQEKGLGSITAASIMGNIAQESMYNTKADSTAFDGNGSVGICQWTNYPPNGPEGRKTNLRNFAKSIGKDSSDLEAQLQFLWKECEEGGYIKPMHDASASKSSVEDKIAAEVESFCFGFERPDRKYANLPARIRYALEAYNKQGKGILAAGTYAPTDTPANGYMGKTSPAKRGTIVIEQSPERLGHKTEFIVKPQDPDKTFCEPVYPDLTSIGEDIPAYSIPLNMPTTDMIPANYETAGAGLVYILPTTSIIEHSDDKNLSNYIKLNEETAKQRKEVFKKAENRAAYKKPSAGKPPNNKDPFPVDHKVVELETHYPPCKIDSVNACHHSLDVAKAVVQLSTDTEKRVVRLENNMATILRYLYRLAARVNINCVYYGGQIPSTYPAKGPNGENNKYCAIRCLKDDRIQEGKQVSLDQCINCTRYEPLIGQVYDILNDAGENLSVVLDDNQMSYTTMDEYYKFRYLEERQTPMESADLMSSDVGERNISEIDLDDMWGPGLAMDWALYPVEMQKPHTNPPVEGTLASSLGANSGSALTNSGAVANMLIEARNQIDAGDSNAKQTGSRFAEVETDRIVSEMKAGRQKDIQEYYKSKNITTGQDACLIAALMAVYGSTVGDTVDKLETAKTSIKGKGVDNIVLHVMFYTTDQKYLFGDGNDNALPKRLDKVEKSTTIDVPTRNADENSAGGTEKQTINASIMPENAWSNVNQWNWNEIVLPLTVNIAGKEDTKNLPEQILSFAKVVYLYKELLAKCSSSRFDTAEWGFPFTEEQIASGLGLNLSSLFGPRNIPESHNNYHYGIDIGVGSGASAGHPNDIKGAEIHAARDGIVYDIATYADNDWGGQQVYLQHDGGYNSWYMHLSSIAVKKGDKVNRGDVIGRTGGSGRNNNPTHYDEHLHFEIHQGGDAKGNRLDPLQFYTGISAANKGAYLSSL